MADEKIASTPLQVPLPLILTDKELAALRAGYNANPGALADAPLAKYGSMYPAGEPYYRMSVETFYTHGKPPGTPPISHLPMQFREVAILSLFIAKQQTITLAIHVYWGLMVGLSVDQICEVTLLLAFYSGIDCYSLALGNIQTTLNVLKKCANAQPPVVDPSDVFKALVTAFMPGG